MIAITSNVQVERPLPLAPSGSTASAGSVVPSSFSAASASAAGSVHSSASTADSVSLSERAEAQLLHQQGQGPSDIASRLDVDVSHVKDDLRITVDGVSLVPSPTRLAATGASPAVTPLVVQPSAPPFHKSLCANRQSPRRDRHIILGRQEQRSKQCCPRRKHPAEQHIRPRHPNSRGETDFSHPERRVAVLPQPAAKQHGRKLHRSRPHRRPRPAPD